MKKILALSSVLVGLMAGCASPGTDATYGSRSSNMGTTSGATGATSGSGYGSATGAHSGSGAMGSSTGSGAHGGGVNNMPNPVDGTQAPAGQTRSSP